MATKTQTPPFQGTPMIKIQEEIPTAGFLEGAFGEYILEEYKGRAKADYGNNPALGVLSLKDGVVLGSNPYAVVLVNQILRGAGRTERTATPADLGQIIDSGECALDLRGTYEDAALVLYSTEGANQYLAENLFKQIGRPKLPLVIPLKDLDLIKDDSPNLGFHVLDDEGIVYAPQLTAENNRRRFTQTDQNGLPIFDENGAKTAYTASDGLRGFFRGRNLYLGASNVVLSCSYEAGRVIIVNSAAAKNFK